MLHISMEEEYSIFVDSNMLVFSYLVRSKDEDFIKLNYYIYLIFKGTLQLLEVGTYTNKVIKVVKKI